jgi:hypothetical protein
MRDKAKATTYVYIWYNIIRKRLRTLNGCAFSCFTAVLAIPTEIIWNYTILLL